MKNSKFMLGNLKFIMLKLLFLVILASCSLNSKPSYKNKSEQLNIKANE